MSVEKFRYIVVIISLSLYSTFITAKYFQSKWYAQKEVELKIWYCEEYNKIIEKH